MSHFFWWFHELCQRIIAIGSPDKTPYTARDMPTQRDLEQLEQEYRERTKRKLTALHKQALTKE